MKKAATVKNTAMFKGAADAAATARAGYNAMNKGTVLYFYNWYAKALNAFSKVMPRSVARKYAAHKNRL